MTETNRPTDNKANAGPEADKKAREKQAPLQAIVDLNDPFAWCNWVATSSIVPEAYRDRPADIFVARQYGQEIGLPAMTSIQNIAIIGGRPALPSDMKLAMVRGLNLLEDHEEASQEEIKKTGIAWCRMKRVGFPREMRHTWTVDDAKVAGVWEKLSRNGFAGPWVTHKWRMLQLKPRDMCLRDLFGDVFKGLHSVEEAREIEIIEQERSAQAQIEMRSQPETKGKEILDADKPPLTPASAVSTEKKAPPAVEPSKPAEPAVKLLGEELEKMGTDASNFTLANLVDERAARLRKMTGGSAALMKIWTSFKLPAAQFGKQAPSQALPAERLADFNEQLERTLLALEQAARK